MKCAPTKFAPTFVVELHPSTGLVKARSCPLDSLVGGDRAHKSGQKVHCAVEGVENRPWELSVPWPNWGFQRMNGGHKDQKRDYEEGSEMGGLEETGGGRRWCHGGDEGRWCRRERERDTIGWWEVDLSLTLIYNLFTIHTRMPSYFWTFSLHYLRKTIHQIKLISKKIWMALNHFVHDWWHKQVEIMSVFYA